MSETAAPTAPEAPKPQPPTPPAQGAPSEAKAEADAARQAGDDLATWKAEARKWEAQAKENKAAAARLAEIEEANKTAEQKAAERLAAAEKAAQESTAEALRYKVAAAKGLDLALAARLTGSTKEELEADADTLMALIPKAPDATPPAPPTGPTVPGQQPGGAQIPALITQSDLDALGAAGKYADINRLRREGRLSHLGVAPQKQR